MYFDNVLLLFFQLMNNLASHQPDPSDIEEEWTWVDTYISADGKPLAHAPDLAYT